MSKKKMTGREVLEEALLNYDGTLLVVSHDRYFINKFAEKTIEFSNGKIIKYDGNYDYYKHSKQIRKDLK